jgi:pimeloyl-ACP methyl ester carboxylesterase
MFKILAGAMAMTAATIVAAPAHAAFASSRVAITMQGTGPDVILIPGLTSSPKIWADTIKAVPGYRYHLVQVKGFAGTAPDANADGIVAAPVAEEISRYISEARLAKPAIVGHSMGGTIAMMIAARHPALPGRVMVVDMMPFMGVMFGGPGATPATLKPIAAKMRAQAATATPETRRAQQIGFITTMVKTPAARAIPTADSLSSNPATVANAVEELIVTDLRPELKAIAVPVTVLYQRPDTAPFTDVQMDGFYRAMYANVPSARLVRVPDAWHFIMLDNPTRFQAELRTFLTR